MKKITICGSMIFVKEIQNLEIMLNKLGFKVYLPTIKEGNLVDYSKLCINEQIDIKNKFIDLHLSKIKKSDAIIVANYNKKNKKNCIGSNTFLEMGFAYAFNKKIFLLNDVPIQSNSLEIQGLKPICLYGNLDYLETYL